VDARGAGDQAGGPVTPCTVDTAGNSRAQGAKQRNCAQPAQVSTSGTTAGGTSAHLEQSVPYLARQGDGFNLPAAQQRTWDTSNIEIKALRTGDD
jgi:hypothetical protein